MTRRNIFIDDVVWKKLKDLALERGTRVSDLVRRAIYEFLKREVG